MMCCGEAWKIKGFRVHIYGFIEDMYEGAMASIRASRGGTNDFSIDIGLHWGSSLSLSLIHI